MLDMKVYTGGVSRGFRNGEAQLHQVVYKLTKRMRTEIRLILLKRRNVQYHLGCWEWESR